MRKVILSVVLGMVLVGGALGATGTYEEIGDRMSEISSSAFEGTGSQYQESGSGISTSEASPAHEASPTPITPYPTPRHTSENISFLSSMYDDLDEHGDRYRHVNIGGYGPTDTDDQACISFTMWKKYDLKEEVPTVAGIYAKYVGEYSYDLVIKANHGLGEDDELIGVQTTVESGDALAHKNGELSQEEFLGTIEFEDVEGTC